MIPHPVCRTCVSCKEISGDDHRGYAYVVHDCDLLDIRIDFVDGFYCAYHTWPKTERHDVLFDERGLS